jgi:hypothetical protein
MKEKLKILTKIFEISLTLSPKRGKITFDNMPCDERRQDHDRRPET